MAHHLHPAAVECLARVQQIVDALNTALEKPMCATLRRQMDRHLKKVEAERDYMAAVVTKLSAYPNRQPEG